LLGSTIVGKIGIIRDIIALLKGK